MKVVQKAHVSFLHFFHAVISNHLSEKPTICLVVYEPGCEKTGLGGFRPGLTQTGLYSHRRRLDLKFQI